MQRSYSTDTQRECDELKVENSRLKHELDIFQSAMQDEEATNFEQRDRVVTKLLSEIKGLREENTTLQKKSYVKESTEVKRSINFFHQCLFPYTRHLPPFFP